MYLISMKWARNLDKYFFSNASTTTDTKHVACGVEKIKDKSIETAAE